MNADNQIRVRYRLSEEEKGEEYHENYGYYEAPNLIVKAKEIPPEQYLENLLAEEPNADTEKLEKLDQKNTEKTYALNGLDME